MSPKELQYIEDALGHEKFLTSQCQQAVSQLSDPELKNTVNQMLAKHREIFNRFYRLV
ncbi:MAG: spore coat protein [Clostridia bacterium]|nr:spore coat protein [Clostridia bacterium]MBR6891167.1 spore coat protein [Clostridia bacterium]